ncbi:MAG: hypothetical protein AAF958_09720 [Planctomycetota bacterium]
MWTIATDEAGYGPKLGPLVVCGTLWGPRGGELTPCEDAAANEAAASFLESIDTDFAAYRHAETADHPIDDSKRVIPAGHDPDRLRGVLETITAVLATHPRPPKNWNQALAAWRISGDGNRPAATHRPVDLWPHWLASTALSAGETAWPPPPPLLVQHWESAPTLRQIGMDVVLPDRFNASLASGRNKSDLLGETTLGVARILLSGLLPLLDDGPESQTVRIVCDRLGGRKFYLGLVNHFFPERAWSVREESKRISAYRSSDPDLEIEISFVVKGDSMVPVAMSSLVAKSVREWWMSQMNHLFAEHFAQQNRPFQPTAGYPVDADRFLNQTRWLRNKLGIDDDEFVRQR